MGRFHLRPCHRLQLLRRSSPLAPRSCSACSRQLANTVGRKAPEDADSLPALRWSSPTLARVSPTNNKPHKANPKRSRAQLSADDRCPVRQPGPHSLPRPAASDSRNNPGKLARDVTRERNSPARGETTHRGRCAAPRCCHVRLV